MKSCVSTSVGTWTNLSTFEPDPDHSPDAGTEPLNLKVENLSKSVKQAPHSEQATRDALQEIGLLFTLVVVQRPGSFPASQVC